MALELCPFCGVNRIDPRWYAKAPCGCVLQACDGCGRTDTQPVSTCLPHTCEPEVDHEG